MARVERYTVPYGDLGIFRTVDKMRELVRHGVGEPLPVETAGLIYQTYCCDGERAQAIRDLLAAHVVFTPDPVGTELLRSPTYLLESIRRDGWVNGDCDDVAILGATLGMAIGFPAQFVLLGFSPTAPYSHVYTELILPDGVAELDTTAPAQLSPHTVVHRRKRIPV